MNKKKPLFALIYTIVGILLFVVSALGFLGIWGLRTWGELDMNEILFQLSSPLGGTGGGMVRSVILNIALPVIIIIAAYIVILVLLKKRKRRVIAVIITLLITIAGGVCVQQMAWKHFKLGEWIEDQRSDSKFIEENYVDPMDVELKFPENKRNLIYIYLESMETTYADTASGGGFQKSRIPNLTRLSESGEDFSGKDSALNGGLVMAGTNFTTGAMFAHTTGLPLKVSIGGNNMDTQDTFFPHVTALGDILEEEGYRELFLLGSDATFGGRRLYCADHGDPEIRDYLYAKEVGWIDEDYYVWWGYEDQKLFDFAKETLEQLSQEGGPFYFSMLTADTHFEEGYVCPLCKNEFPGEQYSNVIACSDRQVAEFIKWIEQQDFYENTTVVLVGDHTTMAKDYFAGVSPDYDRRVYTLYLNADAATADPSKTRSYTTFDLFPTTLASIGVEIEGDRLGLGTNLFSAEETCVEKFGQETVKKEISSKSEFLEELEKVDNQTDGLMEKYSDTFGNTLTIDSYDPATNTLNVRVTEDYGLTIFFDKDREIKVDHFEVEFQEEGKYRVDTVDLVEDEDYVSDNENLRSYIGKIDISKWKNMRGTILLNICFPDGSTARDVSGMAFEITGKGRVKETRLLPWRYAYSLYQGMYPWQENETDAYVEEDTVVEDGYDEVYNDDDLPENDEGTQFAGW